MIEPLKNTADLTDEELKEQDETVFKMFENHVNDFKEDQACKQKLMYYYKDNLSITVIIKKEDSPPIIGC